ncbi:hypothetical protein FRX31_022004 [Thalictrum thalictroides]|uniref:Uncharacterized protein n=1 Tax=Thalictrum thalictroides TaxID=46969 RepID=A0A7J6VUZ2_THATH|nr:hypothetical protein FRX31_022004 [Thalictrum thalictroides]
MSSTVRKNYRNNIRLENNIYKRCWETATCSVSSPVIPSILVKNFYTTKGSAQTGLNVLSSYSQGQLWRRNYTTRARKQ